MAGLARITTPYSYSLAVAVGDFIFLGLHPGSGDDFTGQFHDTFKYMEKTLAEFGLTLAHLVGVNVWLKHIEDLPEMEKRFRDCFEKDRFPARVTSTTEPIDDDCLLMTDGIVVRKNNEQVEQEDAGDARASRPWSSRWAARGARRLMTAVPSVLMETGQPSRWHNLGMHIKRNTR